MAVALVRRLSFSFLRGGNQIVIDFALYPKTSAQPPAEILLAKAGEESEEELQK